eukprot:3319181-Pyramimonas_sp.AAC.2
MHHQKNNWQRGTEMLFGKDFDAGTKQAMRDLEIHPNVTRATDPEPPHWLFPSAVAKTAAKWVRTLPLPRDWANDHGGAFKGA